MRKKVIKTFVIVASVLGLLVIIYFLGPKPNAPQLKAITFNHPKDLPELEREILESEKATQGIKPGCEAQIVWADSIKQRTRYSFLYLHGGTSSHVEANPLHIHVAKKFRANIFLARLAGHGVDLGTETLATTTTDDFIYSAEHALAVARRLGDEVIVLGTSFGGALAAYLASTHPEIKAIVLFSPCFKTVDERMELFTRPWGVKMVKALSGSDSFETPIPFQGYEKHWTTRYDLNFLGAFQNLLEHTAVPSTFQDIHCPVYLAYWYKDSHIQDDVASVPAMLAAFNQIASKVKIKEAFAGAGNHAIVCPQLAKETELVQRGTEKFLESILVP